MWVLVVIGLAGSTAATQQTLADCQRNMAYLNPNEVEQAYCRSAASSDTIWFIKDGKRLIPDGALQ